MHARLDNALVAYCLDGCEAVISYRASFVPNVHVASLLESQLLPLVHSSPLEEE